MVYHPDHGYEPYLSLQPLSYLQCITQRQAWTTKQGKITSKALTHTCTCNRLRTSIIKKSCRRFTFDRIKLNKICSKLVSWSLTSLFSTNMQQLWTYKHKHGEEKIQKTDKQTERQTWSHHNDTQYHHHHHLTCNTQQAFTQFHTSLIRVSTNSAKQISRKFPDDFQETF